MSGIIWLASYPKSGNTWLRVFLSNLLRNAHEAADINALDLNLMAASRTVFEDVTGLDSSDLTDEETMRLRPAVFRHFAQHAAHTLFVKAHDGYRHPCAAEPIIATNVTRSAVYIVRNPLDVAVSYAHHSNRSVDRIIDRMADEEYTMAGRGRRHLAQWLGSWSQHVSGWVDAGDIPVHVIRYEDLSADPMQEFTSLTRFVQIDADEDRIRRAIGFSSFDALSRQEEHSGFAERTARDSKFFRKGKVGNWRESMNQHQAEKLISRHSVMMRRFGYLTDDGSPAF
jgi:hypothetical protein